MGPNMVPWAAPYEGYSQSDTVDIPDNALFDDD